MRGAGERSYACNSGPVKWESRCRIRASANSDPCHSDARRATGVLPASTFDGYGSTVREVNEDNSGVPELTAPVSPVLPVAVAYPKSRPGSISHIRYDGTESPSVRALLVIGIDAVT